MERNRISILKVGVDMLFNDVLLTSRSFAGRGIMSVNMPKYHTKAITSE